MMAAKGKRKAPLSAKTNQRRNTRSGRERMARSSFALPKGTGRKPGQDQYRLDSAAHARNALARASQFASPSEQRTVRRKVAAKYPSITQSGTGSGTKSSKRSTKGRSRT